MLPKIDVPIYSIKLLSTGKEVKYRPFTVKEEKLFLMASESKEMDTIVDTTKQVLNNCILSDIDIDSIPVFDIEYLFLNIRARSVSEVVSVNYNCNNEIKNESDEGTHRCGNVVKLDINLLEIKPNETKKLDNKIQLTNKLGIVMKYPNFNTVTKYEDNNTENILKLTVSCIDYIYDDDQIYYAKDSTEEELIEFIENMQTKDLEKIKEFFDNMPKLSKNLDFKCGKCGYEETITLEGLQSFFV